MRRLKLLMGVMAIVAYRPRPGSEARLLELTRTHVVILREQELVTERQPHVMRAADGTIIEVFEWRSQEAIAAAHTNAAVLAMWAQYAQACEYVPLKTVQECADLFAGFEPIEL